MKTMPIKVHTYDSTIDPATYRKLVRDLTAQGIKCWSTPYFGAQDPNGTNYYNQCRKLPSIVEIETAHLFADQWNTAPIPGVSDLGMRLFHWQEFRTHPGGNLIFGYWLELSPEFRTLLDNTHVCGYCGAQEPAAKGHVFCPHCLDSAYLKSTDLHLTRMRPVSVSFGTVREPLTDAERDHLLPLYRDAQIHGSTARGKARVANLRADLLADCEKVIRDATEKRDAGLWLLDNYPGIVDNWIFYSHTGRHCFGWRSPIDDAVYSELVDVLYEFPYEYDIKRAGK